MKRIHALFALSTLVLVHTTFSAEAEVQGAGFV
jgi:hypothetical protein